MKRKTHVRATVVDCEHLVAFREEAERVPLDADDEASLRAHFIKGRGPDETFWSQRGHRSSPFADSLELQVMFKSSA
jgi:hypothetical protein